MASLEQLRKIALWCDKYNGETDKDSLSLKNSVEEKRESCTNCTHYTREGRCELDLIDKVLSSMSMELDFKS